MRDKNQHNPKELQQDISHFVKQRLPRKILDFRNQIVNDPNFLKELSSFRFSSLKSENLLALAFLSWELPEELGVLIRLDLEPYMKIMNKKDKIFFKIFLLDYSLSLVLISRSKRWHSRDFYGNFLKKGLESLALLRVRKRNSKVKRPKRKRGYHDHGSRRPDSKWLPSFDWSFTLEQNQKESEEIYLDQLFHRIIRILRNDCSSEKGMDI